MPFFIAFFILVLTAFPAWADNAPQSAAAASPFKDMLIPLALSLPVLYLLMIRPQQKQQKERQKMLGEVKKGDEIVTVAGIHGKIVGIADNVLTLEIADQVKVKIDRDAIGRLKTQPSHKDAKS